ncbi:MAG: hypothetical protein AAFP87_12800 [Pseudomonadota bacterium]
MMTVKTVATLVLGLSLCVLTVTPTTAQDADNRVDCEDAANRDDPLCLGLPDPNQPITNFAPVIAPLVGVGALAGLAGGGGTTGTTSTTSTTSTTGN